MKNLSQIFELRSSKGKVNNKKTFGDLKKGDIMLFANAGKDEPLHKLKVQGMYKVAPYDKYIRNVYTNLSDIPDDTEMTYKIDLTNTLFGGMFTVYVNETASWFYLDGMYYVAVDEEEYNEAVKFSKQL